MNKTNAMRLLDAQKIPYRVVEYDAGQEFHTAEEAAALLGASPDSVYKTLVVLPETTEGTVPRPKPLLVMLASNLEIDLRLLAKSIGVKKLRMATKKEAERLTGAQIGAISALAQLNKGFEILLDEPALFLDKIHISAGVRGVDIELSVADLVQVTGSRTVTTTSRAD